MSANAADRELAAVRQAYLSLDPAGSQTAHVLRNTLDQLYDGQRTGRYRWDQLFKTEKTHCGTLVEINLQREFRFADGAGLDYQIAGVEVDCKYSQNLGGWMIPPEAFGHLCLLACAEDSRDPKWSLGLIRIGDDVLGAGRNRDGKASLSKPGVSSITWIFKEAPLPPNVLLQLDSAVAARIMGHDSGQKRINDLFRSAQNRIVGRGVVATVAQQDDYMKRVRGNGGARTRLKPEGIIILGQYEAHRQIAASLGCKVPGKGDSVAVRVARASAAGLGAARIDGALWRLATDADPVVKAPELPKPSEAV